MGVSRWRDVERICEAALAAPADRRAAVLDELCAGDVDLRLEVAALLAQASRTDGFLQAPAMEEAAAALAVDGVDSRGAMPGTDDGGTPGLLPAGTRLGPYEIGAPIGAGGMGTVYEARDTRLDRRVAVKVLPPGFASDHDRRARFRREAKTIAGLNHPHICTLHDVGRDNDTDFLVMELLEGESLAHRLRKGPLPLDQVLDIGAQITDALAAAHRRGIVHRDLKPANVMLTKSGAKLLDFGLAKLRAQPGGASAVMSGLPTEDPATSTGVVMGTVPYMAPEQLGGRETDARTDLFAFGCVLYEMLTGRRAFPGATEASVIAAIMTSEPPPVSTLLPATPAALDRLIRKCLAKDPEARWQHAADVGENLRGVAVDTGARARVSHVRRRGSSRFVMAAGALAVAASAVAAWVLIPWPFQPPTPTRFSVGMPGRAVFACLEGKGDCLAVARDGSGIAYQASEAGEVGIYWSDLRGDPGLRLVGDAVSPFLSPDGHWLGFFRGVKLWKLPLQSGRAAESVAPIAICSAGPVRGATWGEDGTIVFAGSRGGLWEVPAAGGEPRELTRLDPSRGEYTHRFPSFIPGTRALLYQIDDGAMRPERSTIAVLSVDDGQSARIIDGGTYPRYLASGHIVFARRGTLFAVPFDLRTLRVTGTAVPVMNDVWFDSPPNNAGYDLTADGTLVYVRKVAALRQDELVWVGADGRVERAATEARNYLSSVALSRDGQRLAVSVITDDYFANAWVYHLQERRWQRLWVEADCRAPVWSPQGDRLAFRSNQDGVENIYAMSVDGEQVPQRLTSNRNQQFVNSWSPDGRFVAYQEWDPDAPSGEPYISTWVLPLAAGGAPWRLAADTQAAAFSPDGRWIALEGYGESGMDQDEVFIRAFPGPGPAVRVSGAEGGVSPVWGSDGRTIYYMPRLKDTRIMSRRIESFSPLRLSEPRLAFALPFAVYNPQGLQSGVFAVDTDGTRVLVVRRDERRPPEINALQVVEHWAAGVRDTGR